MGAVLQNCVLLFFCVAVHVVTFLKEQLRSQVTEELEKVMS